MLLDRAAAARWTALALTALLSASTPAATDERCAIEVAIPGAYVSACMADAVRQFEFEHVGTLLIEQGAVGPGSTGAAVWRAGEFLASTLAANPSLVRGKRVIELGCGTGLCGLVAARLGASYVLLTDGSDSVAQRAKRNIELNRDSDGRGLALGENMISARKLMWGALLEEELRGKFDVVLASDVLYFTGAWRPLGETVHELLTASGHLIISEAGHDHLPASAALAGFRSVAEPCGLRFDEILEMESRADSDGGDPAAIAIASPAW
mmetsp:Transcript_38/g.122  ORF Transcript_38/g.122 Transcript_38/m.122 type:complete len:267 (+) Transcript_38:338-1138(+)